MPGRERALGRTPITEVRLAPGSYVATVVDGRGTTVTVPIFARGGRLQSIVVDLAVERGGNAELAKPGEIITHNGVKIMGKLNLPGSVPVNASSLYARNLQAFVEPLIDKEKKTLAVNWDDELVKGTLIAKGSGATLPLGGGQVAELKKKLGGKNRFQVTGTMTGKALTLESFQPSDWKD